MILRATSSGAIVSSSILGERSYKHLEQRSTSPHINDLEDQEVWLGFSIIIHCAWLLITKITETWRNVVNWLFLNPSWSGTADINRAGHQGAIWLALQPLGMARSLVFPLLIQSVYFLCIELHNKAICSYMHSKSSKALNKLEIAVVRET